MRARARYLKRFVTRSHRLEKKNVQFGGRVSCTQPGEEKKRKKKKASLSVLPQRIRRHTDTHVIQIYIIHVKT